MEDFVNHALAKEIQTQHIKRFCYFSILFFICDYWTFALWINLSVIPTIKFLFFATYGCCYLCFFTRSKRLQPPDRFVRGVSVQHVRRQLWTVPALVLRGCGDRQELRAVRLWPGRYGGMWSRDRTVQMFPRRWGGEMWQVEIVHISSSAACRV